MKSLPYWQVYAIDFKRNIFDFDAPYNRLAACVGDFSRELTKQAIHISVHRKQVLHRETEGCINTDI